MSLPPRERGLKLGEGGEYIAAQESLPPRERGLKRPVFHPLLLRGCRSPRGSVD